MAGKIGTGATFSGNTGACGLTKTADRLPSRRSLVSVTGGFCVLLFFRLLGFFPALFGALPNAMSNTLSSCPLLDLPFFWIGTMPRTRLTFNDPRTCATARTCSHMFVELFTQARSHFKLPPFPCVTICMLFAYPATIKDQYFNFVIGSRTSTCVLDLWFTYIHYISNGFLIFSTGS